MPGKSIYSCRNSVMIPMWRKVAKSGEGGRESPGFEGRSMFYDSSSHTMDAKNRVFVPKRFQQVLGRDPEGNMVAFLTRGLGLAF